MSEPLPSSADLLLVTPAWLRVQHACWSDDQIAVWFGDRAAVSARDVADDVALTLFDRVWVLVRLLRELDRNSFFVARDTHCNGDMPRDDASWERLAVDLLARIAAMPAAPAAPAMPAMPAAPTEA